MNKITQFEKDLNKRIPGFIDSDEAYKRGYDCGINGSNDWNCNFKIFSTQENTKEWERGKKAGNLKKQLL